METEVEEDTEQTAVDTDMWTEGPGKGTSETGHNQSFACHQSKDGAGETCTKQDGSGVEGVGSVSERPTLGSSNTTSVIVHMAGSGEAGRAEATGDNHSVSTVTPSRQTSPTAGKHPGKVIVTNVTIKSLTVTFKEASVAEGFFKGC